MIKKHRLLDMVVSHFCLFSFSDILNQHLHKSIVRTGRVAERVCDYQNVQGHGWTGEVPEPDSKLHQRLLCRGDRLRCNGLVTCLRKVLTSRICSFVVELLH